MDLTEIYKGIEENGFKIQKRGLYLPEGKFGVKITTIEMGQTKGDIANGKQPSDKVIINLEATEPKEYAGMVTNMGFSVESGAETYGPNKQMTYAFWSLYEMITVMVSEEYLKMPKKAMAESDAFLNILTTKANEHLSNKTFYVERKSKKGFTNTNFLSLDKNEAGVLGAYPDETQVIAENVASAATLTDSDNPFGREVENVASGDNAKDDDDWL